MVRKIIETLIIPYYEAKYSTMLVRASTSEKFHSILDDILAKLEKHATGQNKTAIKTLRKTAKNYSFVELLRLLLQRRLSETPRRKICNGFCLLRQLSHFALKL